MAGPKHAAKVALLAGKVSKPLYCEVCVQTFTRPYDLTCHRTLSCHLKEIALAEKAKAEGEKKGDEAGV